ncbi:thiol:disulfide interchange protein DsbA/DsbL [[Empedobacter] haloabium]|uniref:Thiol:disulfide interchange protein DsbA n=1 Tax=[Empedobacter] haloabium TaxID=592317 RepID=A0ABZ1UJ24_9BURK
MRTSLIKLPGLALAGLLAACTPPDRPAAFTELHIARDRLAPAGDAIDVTEFFMYSCGHCAAFDAPLHAWAGQRQAVRLQRLPIAFSDRDVPLQRLYFAVQALPDPQRLHRRIFDAIHRQHLKLDSEDALADFMAAQGIDRAAFLAAYRAPAVQGQLDRVLALRHRYAVRAVPTLVVADRFVTSPGMVESSALAEDAGQTVEQATLRLVDRLLVLARTGVPGG